MLNRRKLASPTQIEYSSLIGQWYSSMFSNKDHTSWKLEQATTQQYHQLSFALPPWNVCRGLIDHLHKGDLEKEIQINIRT